MSCRSCKSGGGGGLFAIKEALVPLTLFGASLVMKKKTRNHKGRKVNKKTFKKRLGKKTTRKRRR